MTNNNFSIKKLYPAFLVILTVCLAALIIIRLNNSNSGSGKMPGTDSSPVSNADEHIEATVYSIIISEVMPKNKAAYMDVNGAFPDYIELYNYGEKPVNLEGCSLSDKASGSGWSLPALTLDVGSYIIVFADGTDTASEALHTDFSLSDGETVYLFSPEGETVSSLSCAVSQADAVMLQFPDGSVYESFYPSPGYTNTIEGYISWQESLSASGIVINEVVVDNRSSLEYEDSFPDWIEIKNTGASSVNLSGYYLSDDPDDLKKWSFPNCMIAAGETKIIICDSDGFAADGEYLCTNFSLNSKQEHIYLCSSSCISDYVSVKDVPYGCSYGRCPGVNGFFYFTVPTPGAENGDGCRYVAPKPVASEPDGVFNDTESVSVELSADGDIYYTLDGTVPTTESELYTSPIIVSENTIVRAVSVAEGAVTSRTATYSYIFSENTSMPVVSLVIDDIDAYNTACEMLDKSVDIPCNLSLYENGSGFSMGGNVKLTGQASLSESAKKGMRVKFSGAYGDDTLDYDLFGCGNQELTSLSIRTGNDILYAYIRNELCQNLAMQFTDNVISQHGKYCILYLNGEYWGIYALHERLNRQYIADCAGVSKESLELATMEDMRVYTYKIQCYKDIFGFIENHDMSISENYEQLCSVLDIDSFIDWCVVQGLSGNWDMFYRNVTFYRSEEDGGKWKLIYYDLDHAFEEENQVCILRNVFRYNYFVSFTAQAVAKLKCNEEFKSAFMQRVMQALTTVYTNENILSEIDYLQSIIQPEAERDCLRWGRDYADYEQQAKSLRDFILSDRYNYNEYCIDTLCELLFVTEDELMSALN